MFSSERPYCTAFFCGYRPWYGTIAVKVLQRGGRFCVERVKFVKFWEREGVELGVMSGLGGKGVTGQRRKARQSPSGLAGSASSPRSGEPFVRAEPARKASLVKGRCRAQARRRDSWPSAGVTGNQARPVGIPQSADAASPSGPGPSVAPRHLPTLWGVTL